MQKDIQRRKLDELSEEEKLIRAKTDALRLISFRPRSIEEMRGKLKLKKYDDALIDEAIAALKKQNLLNDELFAKFFANSKMFTRPSGKKLLQAELKRKGVSENLVSKTLEGMEDYDEKKTAKELVMGRFERTKDLPKEKRKARIFSFLQRRGFDSSVIFSVLDELFKGEINENG